MFKKIGIIILIFISCIIFIQFVMADVKMTVSVPVWHECKVIDYDLYIKTNAQKIFLNEKEIKK